MDTVMRTEQPLRQSRHHVQLFDSSKSLAETVAAFLLAGFKRGESLLIVVTPEHRELLTRRLEDAGLNVHEALLASRIVILDAAKTLDKFLRQDTLNRAAFDEVVGTQVARLTGKGRRLCVYGEMVDVLAARGNYKAAIQLEHFWNVIGGREHFTLFCGYASGHFGDPRTAPALAEICAAHTHVHRNPDDLLAEFLLDQNGAVPSSDSPRRS
jgi:hypothetical protein